MVNSSNPGNTPWTLLFACFLAASLLASSAYGDQLEIIVQGVEGPLLTNVEARTQSFRVSGNARLSRRRLNQLRADAERRAGLALRPFGYYHAVISSELNSTGAGGWEIVLLIDKGPPVIISDYRVDISGPGDDDKFTLALPPQAERVDFFSSSLK